MNFKPRGIRIRNSKIRIALSDLQPVAFTLAKGFESITRRFESPCLVLHNSSFRDSNHCVGDWYSCFSLSSCSLCEIRITEWVIPIGQPQFPYWNLDSNLFMRDSNRLRQSELFRMWIRIAMGRIRIAFVSLHFLECGFESLYEGFKSPSSNLLEKLQN